MVVQFFYFLVSQRTVIEKLAEVGLELAEDQLAEVWLFDLNQLHARQ